MSTNVSVEHEQADVDERVLIETVTGEIEPPRMAVVSEEPMMLSEGERIVLADDDREQLLCDLEALLFVTSEPLSLPRLTTLTGRHLSDVTECIAQLEERYSDRGLTVRIVGGGYRFATAPRARHAVELLLMPPKTSLSPAAMETLAVVAYSQPVTKAEIEAVRGVSVDGVVTSLVEKGFLIEAGRKETLGRPMLFATTPEFLQSFGLPSLADLPPLPAEQIERLSQEASEEAPALEGTTESGVASPEIEVEIVEPIDSVDETQAGENAAEAPIADASVISNDSPDDDATAASYEREESHDMLPTESLGTESGLDSESPFAQGEHLSQP